MLLLVFSQKMGAGLFLHNLLHSQDIDQPFQSSEQGKANDKSISFACNCIDDFLIPFHGSEEIVLPKPLIEHRAHPEHFHAGVLLRASVTADLRGPPALVL
ncbi:hypothetical protein LZZ85_19230 [Terrimonas sp. NA20]|uniref:Uncharacterized protein n=1 Tax=Terrimonas ginsenosidimutans TaxID=2908004 RepID=A0ABS9KVT7_9BACT|nr:hypothetical protein [Terrimonas ginsenosidimutans]MCG2616441.1 hypothetical protein [Terrimonas ginsenosidimutans]